jgi:hypothetical protein
MIIKVEVMDSVYPGIILFVVLCAVMVLTFGASYSFSDNAVNFSDRLRKFAISLSLFVIVLVLLGLCVHFSFDVGTPKLPAVLFRSAAPLATLCGFFMVYLNFKMQKEENEKKEIREHVETRLKFHVDNMNGFEMPDNDKPDKIYRGRAAFKYFIEVFVSAFIDLQHSWLYISLSAISESNLSKEIKKRAASLKTSIEKDDDKIDEAIKFCRENFSSISHALLKPGSHLASKSLNKMLVVMAYLRMFYSDASYKQWEDKNFNLTELIRLSPPKQEIQKKSSKKAKPIIDSSRGVTRQSRILNYADWSTQYTGSTGTTIFRDSKENTKKKKDGSEPVVNEQPAGLGLDAYFRNLFNLYKYIEEIRFVEIKKSSARLAKSQLSNHEQAILFLNSLTHLGRKWTNYEEKNFIVDNQIIENMPTKLLGGSINPKEVYPKIEFEEDEEV